MDTRMYSTFVVTISLLLLAFILIYFIDKFSSNVIKKIMSFFNYFFGLLLLTWPFGIIGSFFMYISDPEDPFILFANWSIWSYPLIYFLSLKNSRKRFLENFYRASIIFAILPAINLIWFLELSLRPYFYLHNDIWRVDESSSLIEQNDIRYLSACEPPTLDGGDDLDTTGCGTLEVGVTNGGIMKTNSEAHNWQFSALQDEMVRLILLPHYKCPTLKFRVLDSRGEMVKIFIADSSSCQGNTRSYYFDPPATGTYILRIEMPEDPGEYQIKIER